MSFTEPGEMRGSYQPQLIAAACAACHQDKNDHDDDGDFEDPGGVISEPTYLEWLASPYADPDSPLYQSCVDCHMPRTAAGQACVNQDPPLDRPFGDVRSHRIEGTSPAFLDNAATLTISLAQVDDHLDVEATVVNDQTGHHLPTGVTIRNVLLLVEAFREQGWVPLEHLGTQQLPDLAGVGDPAQGYFAGLPGKLYAKVNHGQDGYGPVFFTEATGLAMDTRLAALETDVTSYRFQVPAEGGRLWVRAKLIYRRAWRALLDAKQWTDDGHRRPVEDRTAPEFGHLMELAQDYVDATGTGPGCDGGPCQRCTNDANCSSGERCEQGICVPSDDTYVVEGRPRSALDRRGGCACRLQGAPPAGSGAAAWLGALAIALGGRARRRSSRHTTRP